MKAVNMVEEQMSRSLRKKQTKRKIPTYGSIVMLIGTILILYGGAFSIGNSTITNSLNQYARMMMTTLLYTGIAVLVIGSLISLMETSLTADITELPPPPPPLPPPPPPEDAYPSAF